MHTSKFTISLPFEFCFFSKFDSHATSCAPCTKAKAACKPFDADRAWAKARAEMIQEDEATNRHGVEDGSFEEAGGIE